MKLIDLHPQFLRVGPDGERQPVSTLAEAQGIRFDCPVCGPADLWTIWFDGHGAPASAKPFARWQASGTGYDDLTLSPSLHEPGHWHGWITKGEVTSC